MLAALAVDSLRQQLLAPHLVLRLIVMRYGLSLWLVSLATTWFLAGCGESSPLPATPSATAPESSVAAPTSPDGTLLTNSVGMDLKLIPAGTFIMGDNSGSSLEQPARQVTLTKDFYIGVYEVTQEQYEQVMGTNPSRFKGAQNPVETVSWDDAVAYCGKLSALPAEKAADRVYRLPTETEWEYACRAGTTTAYSFGGDASQLGDFAWYSQNAASTTHPVGQKRPNAWGLYDMHGNLFEWCSDRVGSSVVSRGGSWGLGAAVCRAACRSINGPSDGSINYGFRVALSSPSGQSPEADQ